MANIFNDQNIDFAMKEGKIPEYTWTRGTNIEGSIKSEHLKFNVVILHPGKYSYPYHSHRNAEELFVILEGAAQLRTPDGVRKVEAGDTIFFEKGDAGAHQLYNNTDEDCKYVDIRTFLGVDICDYPDSGKVNILPEMELYEKDSQVDYFTGEKNVEDKWKKL